MRQLSATIIIVGALVILPLNLMAIDLGPGQPCASFKYGRMAAGDIKLGDTWSGQQQGQIKSSRSFGVSFDYPIASHLYLGMGADMQYCYGTLLDLTVNLKGLVATPDGKIAFRPGIGLGGGSSSEASLLTVRASGELQLSVSRQFGIGVETGIWYTPSGGDDFRSIRIGPVRYIRGAILFSSHKGPSVESFEGRSGRLPFEGAVKLGMGRATTTEQDAQGSYKKTDRGLTVGLSADFSAPVVGFVGVAFDWHDLGQSETFLLWGFRGSPFSEIRLGELGFRPVGLIGLGFLERGETIQSGHDQMIYGLSLESFWDVCSGPGWMLEIQYLKLGDTGSVSAARSKLERLITLRLGVTF